MEGETEFESFPSAEKEKKDKKKEQPTNNISDYFIQLSRRIKVLEESTNNLRRKLLVNEQNDFSRHKKILLEEKATLSEINELKKEIENIKRTINEVISELRNNATKEDVEVLKKYIDMWNPINFVTEQTVEKIINEKLSKQ